MLLGKGTGSYMNRDNMTEGIMQKRGQGILFLVAVFIMNIGHPQISSFRLEQFLDKDKQLVAAGITRMAEIRKFYGQVNYQPVWMSDTNLQQNLLNLFDQAPRLGLNKEDYEYKIAAYGKTGELKMKGFQDSITAELRMTDAALHFIHDLQYGNVAPPIGYNGLDYFPACRDIPGLLAKLITANQLAFLLPGVEQALPGYDSLKKKIAEYGKIVADSSFKEVIITSGKVNSSNKTLLSKLFQLGFMDSATQRPGDNELKGKVKQAQKLFNVLADGVLRSTSLEAFNKPLAGRLKELKLAINTLRWLHCIQQSQKAIVVNIPSATLLVYENWKVILESRIIVGKRSTPTPTLCSKITEVILYPYWMVPHSIAVKELLPSIKRNIGFLDANGYQVINKQGRIVNPARVNWGIVSASDFPYIIRQSTGCDNALGVVKLNFYNPYSVYLHDTPGKSLFGLNKRYFSHGCMRVEKAVELAHLVLKNNTIAIDTLEEKGCLNNQAPIVVPADEIIPVFVLYNTAWVDSAGRVSFSEDIYRKNRFATQRH
ncbi:MAG: L,D-transpeptidase family protein [Bacteroidota bacterium]|nr:L,D-transpeptidase family protein [Bacteroidota bacterium]